MGKLTQQPHPPGEAGSPNEDGVLIAHGTPEQREKNRAALEWLGEREAAYEALPPEEKAASAVVATSNVGHLSHFVTAKEWRQIGRP